MPEIPEFVVEKTVVCATNIVRWISPSIGLLCLPAAYPEARTVSSVIQQNTIIHPPKKCHCGILLQFWLGSW